MIDATANDVADARLGVHRLQPGYCFECGTYCVAAVCVGCGYDFMQREKEQPPKHVVSDEVPRP